MSGDDRRKVPALLVEKLALGELDGAEAARVREALGGDAAAAEALARIETSNQEILSDYPPETLEAAIRRRAEAQVEAGRPRRSAIAWVLAPALVAAAVVVWVIVRDDATKIAERVEIDDSDTGETTRIKGSVDPHLVIDRRTAAGHERLGAGELVREGDLLQVSYVPAGHGHGVIVSIDGAGAVTLHHPAEIGGSTQLREGTEIPLAHSYELDDAPSFERFVFVTRDGEPPAVDEVVRAAEQLARSPGEARARELDLEGPGWSQHSLLLRKPPSSATGDPSAPTPAGADEDEDEDEGEGGGR